ncbi:hypothetical protein AVEN_108662-1 [Araneus ventricosus]|uniref:Uncharacterized protein n=1 Tax=Araneus ventricosus TaxID=182803 RepID=A0A4Y2PTY2_ARAVE|nr:hypothetical protein AVEN_108662-1 [Araneus ventricosus]
MEALNLFTGVWRRKPAALKDSEYSDYVIPVELLYGLVASLLLFFLTTVCYFHFKSSSNPITDETMDPLLPIVLEDEELERMDGEPPED